jgi:hypothetical protein
MRHLRIFSTHAQVNFLSGHQRSMSARQSIQSLKTSMFQRSKDTPCFSSRDLIALKSPPITQGPDQLDPMLESLAPKLDLRRISVGLLFTPENSGN